MGRVASSAWCWTDSPPRAERRQGPRANAVPSLYDARPMSTEHKRTTSLPRHTHSTELIEPKHSRWAQRGFLPTALLLLCAVMLGGQGPWTHSALPPRQSDPAPTGMLWAGRPKTPKKVAAPATSKSVESLETSTAREAKKTAGETETTKRGRQAHTDWQPGEGYEKEVRLPSGRRADAVNAEKKDVKELKPNNPRAIKRGEKQVETYRRELEEKRGGQWTGQVETYETGEKK
ncbi:hypothetical protein F0U59_46945 [Archangium gephyra]|nr:hypothetical protein F0U59_46945 [Archangium gephyra]